MKVLKAIYTPTKLDEEKHSSVPDPDNAITVSIVEFAREPHSSGFDIVFFDVSGEIGVDTMWCFSYFRWEEV